MKQLLQFCCLLILCSQGFLNPGFCQNNFSIYIPLDTINHNHYYEICTANTYQITGTDSFVGTDSTVKVFIPRGGCLLNSGGTDTLTYDSLSSNPLYDIYHFSAVTSPFIFRVDLSAINCVTISDQLKIGVQNGIQALIEKPVQISRPSLVIDTIAFGIMDTCVKGHSYSRTYNLDAFQAGNYTEFSNSVVVEQELLITDLSISFYNSLGDSVTTVPKHIKDIDCTMLPADSANQKNAESLLSSSNQQFILWFAKDTTVTTNAPANAIYIELPDTFGTHWNVRVTEMFTVISHSPASSLPQTLTIYSIDAALCHGISACGDTGQICTSNHSGSMNVRCNFIPPSAFHLYTHGSGNSAGHDYINIYDSSANHLYYRIHHGFNSANNTSHYESLKEAIRLYLLRLYVDSNYFSVQSSNDVIVGTLNLAGTFFPLNPQPSISILHNGGTDTIDICFKNIALGTTNPDANGQLDNAFPNPANLAAKYYCDLLAGSDLVIEFDNIRFNPTDATLHSCNYQPVDFIPEVYWDIANMSTVDLCTSNGRQIYSDTNSARCSQINHKYDRATLRFGTVSGIEPLAVILNQFTGNVNSFPSNTDIGAAVSPTQVNLTYTFYKTSGRTPWQMATRPSLYGAYLDTNILARYGETYYAHVTIPAGFQIIPQNGATYIVTIDSLGIPVSRPHDTTLVYDSVHCNTYNLVLDSLSSSISFYIQMTGCPSHFSDSVCPGLITPETFNSGFADIPLEFRSQLNDSAHNHSLLVDTSLRSLTYGCTDILMFYHCTGPCDYPPGTANFSFKRNTFGWPSDSAYILGTSPQLTSPPDTILGYQRVYINDSILVTSTGWLKDTIPNPCYTHLNFQVSYDAPPGSHNIFDFDYGKLIVKQNAGQAAGQINTFNLTPANQHSLWDTDTIPSHDTLLGNNILVVSIGLDSLISVQALVDSSIDDSLFFIGHYHVDCAHSSVLEPGHYKLKKLRGQFTVSDSSYSDSTCYFPSCDPWGAPMEILVIRNRIIESWAVDGDSALNRTCDVVLTVTVNSTGGYPLQEDFPNEYRPIIEYPNDFSLNLLDNLYLSKATVKKTNAYGQYAYGMFNIAGACPAGINSYCPDSSMIGGPLNPGGKVHFHLDSASHRFEVNQNNITADSIPTIPGYRVQTKDEEQDFTFYATRSCYTIPSYVRIDSIHIPVQSFHSYNEYLDSTGNWAKAGCTFALPYDSVEYPNYTIPASYGGDVGMVLNASGGTNPHNSAGNHKTFSATFFSHIAASGWIYCSTPGVVIDSITLASGIHLGHNAHGLFYFDCPVFSQYDTSEAIEISMHFPCFPGNAPHHYDSTFFVLHFGAFCNRCVLPNLNPASASHLAMLTSCEKSDSIRIGVKPGSTSVDFTATADTSQVSFCNPATFTIHYLVDGEFNNAYMDVINENDTAPGVSFILYDASLNVINGTLHGDTMSFPMPDDTSFSFVYFPGCSLYNGSYQTFYFSIRGKDGCDSSYFIPNKEVSENNFSVTFQQGDDPFIGLTQTSFSSAVGCGATIHDTIRVTYDSVFTGDIHLMVCPQFSYSSVSSSDSFTVSGTCIRWIIPANSSGDTSIILNTVLDTNICSGIFDLPATVSFTKNCFDSTHCPIGNQVTIHSTLQVNCLALPVSILPTYPVLCQGSSGVTLTATDTTLTHHWYLGNNSVGTSHIYFATSAGVYTDSVTNANGCKGIARDTVRFDSLPTVSLSANLTSTCSGAPVILTATALGHGNGISKYSWSNGSTTTPPTLTVSPTVTTNYTVSAVNIHGCTSTASSVVTIQVANCCYNKDADIIISSNLTIGNTTWTNKIIELNANLTIPNTITLNIEHTTVEIAPGVRIIVQSGGTLNISDSSLLHACHDMWAGIIVDTNGTLNIENSTITDADTAVINHGGVQQLKIAGSLLKNNNVGISLTNDAYGNSFLIYGTKISGGTLSRAPYAGLHASSGIQLKNAHAVAVGVPAENRDTIEDVDLGINAYISDVSVQHVTFNNIITPCSPALDCFTTYAILSNGIISQINSLNVGGSNANEKCTFTNCTRAIRTDRNIQNKIIYNTFTIDPATYSGDTITEAVGLFHNNYCYENISDNYFNNYDYGIELVRVTGDTATVIINHNIFNNNSALINSDAIQVRNNLHDLENAPAISITNNSITRYRRGILTTFLSNQARPAVRITDNIISPDGYANSPVPMYYGIKSQGCVNNLIDHNYFYRVASNPGSNTEDHIMGITVERGSGNGVTNNTTTKAGTGIRFFNCTAPNTVICNQLITTYSGITLTASRIDNQGSSGAASDNMWELVSNPIATIQGKQLCLTCPTPIWWVQTGTYPYDPGPTGVLGFIFPSTTVIPSTASANTDCISPCTDPQCTQNKLHDIVMEQGNYSGLDDDAKYDSKVYVFKELINNPDLKDLGTAYDYDLQVFYDSISQTNIGALYDVDSLINNNDTAQATIINTSISPENMSEENATTVNYVYIKSWAEDRYVFTESETNTLLNIAYQNPVTGGDAVYDARVMLMIDADDYLFDEMRIGKTHDAEITPDFGKIIPNPNSGMMQFSYKIAEGEQGTLQIFDTKGKPLKIYNLQSDKTLQDIDMNDVVSGLYLYRFTVNGKIVLCNKIVIQK